MSQPIMDFDEWLKYGEAQGYCSSQVCATHDWVPMTDREMEDDNGDFCVHVVRLGTPEIWDADFIVGDLENEAVRGGEAVSHTHRSA